MRFRTNWLDVTYERLFARPSFELAASPVTVLRALHEAISPRYPLGSVDLSVEAGRSVADVRVKAALFDGNGAIEVTADGFKGAFTNPIGPGALEKVKDCLALGLDAVQSALPNLTLALGSITARYFVELIDKPQDAHTYLRELMANTTPQIIAEGQDVEVVPGLKVDLMNSAEKWSFSFQLERAVRSRTELFSICASQYQTDGMFCSIDEQAKHHVEFTSRCLSRIGLVSESQP